MNNPPDWPYAIRVKKVRNPDRSPLNESKAWCEEKFGPVWEAVDYRTGSWCCVWCGPRDYENYRFHFRNSEDAVLFALRWS